MALPIWPSLARVQKKEPETKANQKTTNSQRKTKTRTDHLLSYMLQLTSEIYKDETCNISPHMQQTEKSEKTHTQKWSGAANSSFGLCAPSRLHASVKNKKMNRLPCDPTLQKRMLVRAVWLRRIMRSHLRESSVRPQNEIVRQWLVTTWQHMGSMQYVRISMLLHDFLQIFFSLKFVQVFVLIS